MKIMISQPMNGRPTEQVRAERELVVKQLEAKGNTIVDTIFAESPEKAQNKPVWYLSQAIAAMSEVDAVYFMKGWNNARGCIIEHQIAESYGITIISE